MLRHSIMFIFCLLAMSAGNSSVRAQEISRQEVVSVSNSIYGYIGEVYDIASRISRASLAKLPALERSLEAVNFRWEAYLATEQLVIVQDKRLMTDMAKYQELYMVIADSLASRKVQLVAIDDFKNAEAYINSVIPEYKTLYDKAFKLSLVKQAALQLAKVKTKEQVLFQKVQQEYQKAQSSALKAPSLSKKAEVLDNHMANIMMQSEKIQALEYKPLIDRVKDYLMSFAAVAMILMFISTVKSKIAAVKAQKEAAQKYKDALKNDEYPTI